MKFNNLVYWELPHGIMVLLKGLTRHGPVGKNLQLGGDHPRLGQHHPGSGCEKNEEDPGGLWNHVVSSA